MPTPARVPWGLRVTVGKPHICAEVAGGPHQQSRQEGPMGSAGGFPPHVQDAGAQRRHGFHPRHGRGALPVLAAVTHAEEQESRASAVWGRSSSPLCSRVAPLSLRFLLCPWGTDAQHPGLLLDHSETVTTEERGHMTAA